MATDPRDAFRSRIGATIGVDPARIALFAKGRVALYAILRALRVGAGDEVILPAFTCVAVPNAIAYTGARPVWVDIDPATYTIDPACVAAAVGPRSRVILAQNTFGLSADLDPILDIANAHGLAVVDDCAHGLGGSYRGRPNGAATPFAFLSTQWSKPVSTGLGGVAIDRDGLLGDRLRLLERAARAPSPSRRLVLSSLVVARGLAGHGRLLQGGRSAYRALSRLGLVPSSSSRGELAGTELPDGFLAAMPPDQARLGARRLERLPTTVARRRAIAARYTAWLRREGLTAAEEPAWAQHGFLRYPLRVRDPARFRAEASRSGVDAGDWFVSPVHPVTDRLERWAYATGTAPVAERACREIVNLPTDPDLAEADVARVLTLLERQRGVIR